jgi:hypothetical protein
MQFNRFTGCTIIGAGTSYLTDRYTPNPVGAKLNGSIGLGIDSSEPHAGGNNYQNTVDSVSISNIDIGVRLSGDVNGNIISK